MEAMMCDMLSDMRCCPKADGYHLLMAHRKVAQERAIPPIEDVHNGGAAQAQILSYASKPPHRSADGYGRGNHAAISPGIRPWSVYSAWIVARSSSTNAPRACSSVCAKRNCEAHEGSAVFTSNQKEVTGRAISIKHHKIRPLENDSNSKDLRKSPN